MSDCSIAHCNQTKNVLKLRRVFAKNDWLQKKKLVAKIFLQKGLSMSAAVRKLFSEMMAEAARMPDFNYRSYFLRWTNHFWLFKQTLRLEWYETFILILPLSFSLPKQKIEEVTILRHLITLPIVKTQADRRVGSLKILVWKDFFILTKYSPRLWCFELWSDINYNRKEWFPKGDKSDHYFPFEH